MSTRQFRLLLPETFKKKLKIGVGHFFWPNKKKYSENFSLVELAWNGPYISVYALRREKGFAVCSARRRDT